MEASLKAILLTVHDNKLHADNDTKGNAFET